MPRFLLSLFLEAHIALSFLVISSSCSSETLTLQIPSNHSTFWPLQQSSRLKTPIFSNNSHYKLRSHTDEDPQERHNQTLPRTLGTFLSRCGDLHKNQALRVAGLVVWILILFYLMGTTASDYFSCTLEKLSDALSLSPAVAGVTLLAIGNGAPDVFSSVAAFVSSDQSSSIGFSSVLGGALFVTTVVSGSVALVTARVCKFAGSQRISSICFVRDALFLLAAVGGLTGILLDGKVRLWESISFFCVYVVYTATVWAAEMLENRCRGASSLLVPLIPKGTVNNALPQWSSSQSQSHHYHIHSQDLEAELEYYLETSTYHTALATFKRYASVIYRYGIELPLAVPRRLTIPVIEEERWSRPVAIASCVLAPLFVGVVYLFQIGIPQESILVTLLVSGAMGILLGLLGLFTTEKARPPSRCVWLWLAGGFVMSIVWFFIVADQLVGSLEALGSIFHISSAILGLTVLAWGNSIGDLVADLALACGGRDGVQIAISGCYAGPLFNTVFGLGLSLVVACAKAYPEPLVIADEDDTLFVIIGFLGADIVWALLMIPWKSMRLSKTFGSGLILLYSGFLITGFCYAMGWIRR